MHVALTDSFMLQLQLAGSYLNASVRMTGTAGPRAHGSTRLNLLVYYYGSYEYVTFGCLGSSMATMNCLNKYVCNSIKS